MRAQTPPAVSGADRPTKSSIGAGALGAAGALVIAPAARAIDQLWYCYQLRPSRDDLALRR